MRVLVVSAPLIGHVFPLVPLALALRSSGHEVMVATGGGATAVRDAGLAAEDIAPGFRMGPVATRMLLRHPLAARAELAGTAGTRVVGPLFGLINDRMMDAVAALVGSWRPDLVVYEPLAVAGAYAAAAARVPAVLHENVLFDGPTLVAVTAPRMRRARTATLPPDAAAISIAPPSVVPGRAGWPMRAVAYGGDAALPDPLGARPDRPRVAVTRSTVGGPGEGRLMSTVAAAAVGVDADFVLIRPDKRVAAGRLPANVSTVGWVSIAALLATCTAVVHHGGAGTALAALGAGVPQLVVNGPADRRHNACLIAARGAGIALDERDVTAAVLTRLVTDPALASSAAEVRDEMAAMPAPADLVPRLAELVRVT
jgi:UDP:flavonoid glycosyltransferase YjiC (YdhE family)